MIYDKIIEFGILFLLIYTPLAFGTVTEYPITLFEMTTGGLLLVWLAKLLAQRKRVPRDEALHRNKHYLRFISAPITIPLCFLFVCIFLQRVPLPVSFVKLFSPGIYNLYAEAAGYIAVAVPQRLPLSVCTRATETQFVIFLTHAAVFFLIINNVRRPQQVNRLIVVIIAMGFLEALYGLLQLFSGQQFLPFYPKQFWVSGSFINKNHFAGYLEMVILLTFGVIFTRFEKRRSSQREADSDPVEEKYAKVSMLLFIALMMIGAHLSSGSRGGIVSLGAGIIFFVILVNLRRLLRGWVVGLLIVLPLILMITGLMIPNRFIKNLDRFAGEQFDLSFRTRWEIWRTQSHIFQDFPISGSGFGTLPHIARRYQTFRWTYRLVHSESDYMQLLAETGIVGTLLAALTGLLFFASTLAIWKRRRSRRVTAIVAGGLSALVSIVVHSGGDFNLHIPSNALLLSVIAAITYTTVSTHKGQYHEKRRTVALSPVIYYSIVLLAAALVGFYMRYSIRRFRAFEQYQDFTRSIAAEKPLPADAALRQIQTAIRYDGYNAEYYYALGKYLQQYYADTNTAETTDSRKQGFDEAEKWLQKAILLDPANPWPYYQIGRLSLRRGDCPSSSLRQSGENDCPAMRYFLAALKNYPKGMFLRKQIGGWLYRYDQEAGLQLIRNLRAGDEENPAENPRIAREFANFLYDLQLEYESDREAAKMGHIEKEQCKASVILQHPSDEQVLELGDDDGSGEWRTRLTSETLRIKKVFCLPENLAEYRSAALKILMNRGGHAALDVRMSLNEHLLPLPDQTFSYVPEWHEIPFDITLLHGQSSVNVYIRARAATAGSYLQIWGDQDTPNARSIFNFRQTGDLSPDEGKQTGEYMIRLVLKKKLS